MAEMVFVKSGRHLDLYRPLRRLTVLGRRPQRQHPLQRMFHSVVFRVAGHVERPVRTAKAEPARNDAFRADRHGRKAHGTSVAQLRKAVKRTDGPVGQGLDDDRQPVGDRIARRYDLHRHHARFAQTRRRLKGGEAYLL